MEEFTLSTGERLSHYSAVMIAEGVEDVETQEDLLMAWSYIGKHELYLQLQGFFGRTLKNLVDSGYLDQDFNII